MEIPYSMSASVHICTGIYVLAISVFNLTAYVYVYEKTLMSKLLLLLLFYDIKGSNRLKTLSILLNVRICEYEYQTTHMVK